MLKHLQKWVGCLILALVVIVYIWMICFKDDVSHTGNSPYARDRFFELDSDARRMNINREAQNLARDPRFYAPRE